MDLMIQNDACELEKQYNPLHGFADPPPPKILKIPKRNLKKRKPYLKI